MGFKNCGAKPAHEALFQDLCAMLKRHDHLSKIEMLAVTANFLGKLLALQDQTRITPEVAMEIIARNIEQGNQQAIATLSHSEGTA